LVLPGTWSASLFLIVVSIICFGLWPNLLKVAGAKWRFEMFAFDFGLGAMLVALVAAYTLGTMGSALGFSDSMLVSGRRIELLAFLTGGAFALANLFYLATISLLGLANATLLAASIFGCVVGLMNLEPGLYLTSSVAAVVLIAAAAFVIASTKAKPVVPETQAATVSVSTEATPKVARTGTTAASVPKPAGYYGRPSRHAKKIVKPPMSASIKGVITGILAGSAFAGVVPLLSLIQPPIMGIGAYGGMLLGTIGLFFFTFLLNFFFLNVALEGSTIGFTTYFTGTGRNHALGLLTGSIWSAGAIALYAAYTGAGSVTWFDVWVAPFTGALLAVLSGLMFWAKSTQVAGARRNALIGLVLYLGGVTILLAGFRREPASVSVLSPVRQQQVHRAGILAQARENPLRVRQTGLSPLSEVLPR
jgi:glucose uptake protein